MLPSCMRSSAYSCDTLTWALKPSFIGECWFDFPKLWTHLDVCVYISLDDPRVTQTDYFQSFLVPEATELAVSTGVKSSAFLLQTKQYPHTQTDFPKVSPCFSRSLDKLKSGFDVPLCGWWCFSLTIPLKPHHNAEALRQPFWNINSQWNQLRDVRIYGCWPGTHKWQLQQI